MQVKWVGLGLSSLKGMQINNKSGLTCAQYYTFSEAKL